ncbi:hypothetical protein QZH41_013939 [Actinostola sp. cb2023]|nr:hypothetical protein QZH41_013939 [Actinostola sp. cb2023]
MKSKPANNKRTNSRFYPTEDVPRKLAHRKKPGKTRLRQSISPGTVLILLAGNHRGKVREHSKVFSTRVIFLKQLDSGLLLVTGPYKVNGVPLRRVSQTYVIATGTTLDVSGVNLPDHLNDDYYKRQPKKKKRTEDMFEDTPEEKKVSDKRIEDQKTVDDQVLPLISNVAHMKKYLKGLFTLRHGQYPHQMKF